MKKAILTIGLFSMVMVLTSFTTPQKDQIYITEFALSTIVVTHNQFVLPETFTEKYDIEPGTVSPTVPSKKLDFEPGTVSPTVPTKKLDFEPGTVSPTVPSKKLD